MKHLNQNRRLWASGGRISEAGAAGAAAWLRHEGVVAKRPHQDEGLGDGSLHPGGNSDVENPTREIMYRKWSTNAGENPHRSVSFQEASGVPKFGVKSQSGRKNIPNALHLEPYSINQRLTTISILVFDHRKQLVVVDVPRDIDPILYGELDQIHSQTWSMHVAFKIPTMREWKIWYWLY